MKPPNEELDELPPGVLGDETLEELAHGRLDDDDVAFLRALAEGDEQNEARLEAYAPIGEERRAEMAERLAWRIRVERRSRRVRGVLASGLAVAAAAAAALLMVPFGRDGELPGYRLDLGAGARTERSVGAEVAVPEFTSTTRLELVLRPEERVSGDVAASGWLRGPGEGAPLEPWPVHFEVAEGGAIRVAGEARELLPNEPGEYALHLIVARHLPDAVTQRAWVEANDSRVLSTSLVLTASP